MKNLIVWINQLDWGLVVMLCGTLGLAPFAPPHIIEKLGMLFRGSLIKPLDWFDLFLHGFPWVILIIKVVIFISNKK
ncbi:MAG: RND transporter [Candidatus Omnitrophica bacterium]|nr:RND transporter [Candidatus Omnitrophota bacterium]